MCGACSHPLSNPVTDLVCHFATKGFSYDDKTLCKPCGVGYHQVCFRAGPPFNCRRRNREGLRFPKTRHWPLFICECCTVRSVLDRELGGAQDRSLLRLERMRILDVANSWATGTHRAYATKLDYLSRFERDHKGLILLAKPTIDRPPKHLSITLAWVEGAYSLRPSTQRHKDFISFGTIRQLRSAIGWHHTVAQLIGEAGEYQFDSKRGNLQRVQGLPTQAATLVQYTKGLRERIGDNPEPSWALLDRHIRALDAFFDTQYRGAPTSALKERWARAGLTNILLWLGWLRSRELFDLRWMDITCVNPSQGPQYDLPPNVGCLLLRLDEQTKTDRTTAVDVPIAYATRSGYYPGRWYKRLCRLRPTQGPPSEDPHYVFIDSTGRQWDSYYFRNEFIYPMLYKLQLEGDPHLQPLKGGPGNTIPEKYKSIHMYRRGARSHADIIREKPSVRRKASPVEVYEHARWRMKRNSEAIDVMYRQWTLFDRIQLTLYCM